MGATATGKSHLAIALAGEFQGEIVSMDSRQVYRGLDIGTGKVDEAARQRVPHHLLDYLGVNESGSTGRHIAAAETAMLDIAARGRTPFLVGGTGLYFRALFSGLVEVTIPPGDLARIRAGFEGRETPELYQELVGLDPERAGVISPNDRVRITRALELIAHTETKATDLYAKQRGANNDIVYLKLVLSMPREKLRERIAQRTRELFEQGWPQEVARLMKAGVDPRAPGMLSLGYADIAAAISNREDPAEALETVITITRQYAKRQETFFRSEKDAVWIDMTHADATAQAHSLVEAFLGAPKPH